MSVRHDTPMPDRGDPCYDSERSEEESEMGTSDEEFLNDAEELSSDGERPFVGEEHLRPFIVIGGRRIYVASEDSDVERSPEPSPSLPCPGAPIAKRRKRVIHDEDSDDELDASGANAGSAEVVVDEGIPAADVGGDDDVMFVGEDTFDVPAVVPSVVTVVVPVVTPFAAPVSVASAVSVDGGEAGSGEACVGGNQMKHFCFTYNNYPLEWDALPVDQFKSIVAKFIVDKFLAAGVNVAYLCVGKEVAPTTGTRHLQGYLALKDKKRVGVLAKAFPGLHFIVCKGTPVQNVDYCEGNHTKKGFVINPYFSFVGSVPNSGGVSGGESRKKEWDDARVHAIAGDYEKCSSHILITQIKNLQTINKMFAEREVFVNPFSHRGVWIHSDTPGVGKTAAVREQFGTSLFMKAHDAMWNEYSNETVALLDDFHKEDARSLGHLLKNWCDDKMFTGRVLYGTVKVHLKFFIVTSNYSIEELFFDMGPQIYKPVAARFRQLNWEGTHWSTRAGGSLAPDILNALPLGPPAPGLVTISG